MYRIFRCISRDFKTEKFAPKIDLDLYTDDNFKVSKMCADFLICCSNLFTLSLTLLETIKVRDTFGQKIVFIEE